MSAVPMMALRVDSTSALGAMRAAPQSAQVVLFSFLVVVGTTANFATSPPTPLDVRWPVEQTTSGSEVVPATTRGAAMGELRRLSGLTWDQLARLLGVSRRTMHFWASGKSMASANEEHLQRVLAVLRQVDRGTAAENRTALLESGADGIPGLDLLTAKRYDRAVSLLGSGRATRISVPKLAAETIEARRPLPPQDLVGALHDTVHHRAGPSRVAKTVRRTVGG